MDKQKQIEEMANCLIGCRVTGADSTKVLSLGYITVKEIASILVNEGYRKIPENAVVLTNEEQMARDYECYNLGYETHRQESQKREDYIKTLEYHINDLERALIIARKETAEKYHAEIEKAIESVPNATKEFVETWKAKNDEICKEVVGWK